MLFRTPKSPDAVQQLNSIWTNLRYAAHAPRRWTGLLRRMSFARNIRGSNSIEGYNVTREDALAAVDSEEPLEAQSQTWAAVTGYRKALTYVLELSSDPHFEYGEGYIRSLHYMMLDYDLARHPGSWRPGPRRRAPECARGYPR